MPSRLSQDFGSGPKFIFGLFLIPILYLLSHQAPSLLLGKAPFYLMTEFLQHCGPASSFRSAQSCQGHCQIDPMEVRPYRRLQWVPEPREPELPFLSLVFTPLQPHLMLISYWTPVLHLLQAWRELAIVGGLV